MRNKLLILSLILSIFATSCASRKVQKSEVKEKTEVSVVDSTKTEKTEVTTNVIIDTTSTTEIEIVPVDNTKPITVNNKTYFNARIKVKKVKNGVSVVNEKKASQIEQKAVKTNIVATKEVKTKETERKPDYSWWWLVLIIGIVIIIYRKYLRHWI